MAASLRPLAFTRLFTSIHRLTGQPVCLTRPLCRVPPEQPEGPEGVKETDADKNAEAKENLSKSQTAGTQADDKGLPHETEVLAKKNEKLKPSEASNDFAAKEESVEKKQNKIDDKKATRQKKLHDLLSSLATSDPTPVEPQVQLSRPKARKKAKRGEQKTPPSQTEPDIDPQLVTATKEVAKSLGGDAETTESELLSTLRLHSPETTAQSPPSLSELFVGMKVERKPKSQKEFAPRSVPYDKGTRDSSQFTKQDTTRHRRTSARPPASSVPRTPVDLFGAPPLGIFGKETVPSKSPAPLSVLPTWERLQAHELQLSTAHPPTNAFVEMIQWTKEGKLWTFPVDNEIGLEEEKKVGFHEHVFLERHLEGWCPRRGPIRHFMELVCTGLSKNPYLTVERKKAHIEWYKNYFAEKEELLKELGAIESAQ